MADTASTTGKTALVLEGGSFRAQFSAGVLDVFMEHGIEFDACYGVSAGALGGLSVKSRQIGRVNRVNLAFCGNSRYMGAKALVSEHSMIGYDFMLSTVHESLDPLDFATYMANPMPLYAVVTDMVFGTADFLEVKNPILDIDRVQASTSLPLITQPVEIDGHLYMDGGIADSVPVEHVLEKAGYDQAVVVLTRERTYVRTPYQFMAAARAAYADYPLFVETMATRHDRYNEQREHIWAYEKEGRAFVIAPTEPVDVSQIERDTTKLLALYLKGRKEGLRQLAGLQEFLGR